MALTIKCTLCDEELDEPGAVLLSPPDKYDRAKKRHICTRCHNTLLNIFRDLRQAMAEKKAKVQPSGADSHS